MTEKKLKRHLHRIWFHYDRLRAALNEAHHAGVIVYEGDYQDVAPCWAMDEMRDRLKAATKDVIAETIHDEIRDKIR